MAASHPGLSPRSTSSGMCVPSADLAFDTSDTSRYTTETHANGAPEHHEVRTRKTIRGKWCADHGMKPNPVPRRAAPRPFVALSAAGSQQDDDEDHRQRRRSLLSEHQVG